MYIFSTKKNPPSLFKHPFFPEEGGNFFRVIFTELGKINKLLGTRYQKV